MTPANGAAIVAAALAEPVRAFLPRQRWYAGEEPPTNLSVSVAETIGAGTPAIVDLRVDADGARYQVPIGLRPADERPDFLRGRDDALLGDIEVGGTAMVAYDALVDPDLAFDLLKATGGQDAPVQRVRPVGGEQSNSSLVYDDRLILKLFRRVHPGPNLDIEVTEALAEAGFDHVARPLGVLTREWEGERYDLAVLQPFLAGAVDGWALALTSLRDLFGVGDTQPVPVITDDMPPPAPRVDPADAGGDFSAEARRLGTITAEMHVGLAKAFGGEPGDGRRWADDIERQVRAIRDPRVDVRSLLRRLDALRRTADVGPAIRSHGDYHLGQVLRTDAGWFVLDFEGEPARPPSERRRTTSPLRDVAGMVRSFHYASRVGLIDRDEDCHGLGESWEARNRKAYLEGYVRTAASHGLLPDPAATEHVLGAFELEKAVYELHYEQNHRPEWVSIPLDALQRLAAG